MLTLIVRWRSACFGSFASLMFAGVRAPDSMLIIIMSTLSTLVHRCCTPDICVTVSTHPRAVTAVEVLVVNVHWLCHLELGLIIDKVHWLRHLDLGLLVVDCVGSSPRSG